MVLARNRNLSTRSNGPDGRAGANRAVVLLETHGAGGPDTINQVSGFYCTCAMLVCLAASAAAQQPAASAASTPTSYRVFMRGTLIGREDVTVQQSAAGLTVVSQGRLAAPL